MCIFSRTVSHVEKTKLFARRSVDDRQFLVYAMAYQADTELAMILPLPTPPSPPEDAVRFIDLSGYPNFFDDIESGFPPPAALRSLGPPKSILKVYNVGSFEASFVPRLEDFARLDERFRLPDILWNKLPLYHDYGFAVFKLKAGATNVHPMAFEFPRRDPNYLFFPTVHVHHGHVEPEARFDHRLYCQSPVQQHYWERSKKQAKEFMSIEKTQGIVAPDDFIQKRVIRGLHNNADIVLEDGLAQPRAIDELQHDGVVKRDLWEQWIELIEAAAGSRASKELVELDWSLAQRVIEQSGELEARLLAGIDELAHRHCSNRSYPSLLAFVLDQRIESVGLLPESSFVQTLRALSPEGFLRFFVAARAGRGKAELGVMALQNSVGLAKWYVAQNDVTLLERIPMAPELHDTLGDGPLPDILPNDVAKLSIDEIADAITRYTGAPIDQTEARMRAGASSYTGFLGRNERLAEVIHRDAQTLARIGVDRHTLAERIELLIDADFHNAAIDTWPTPEQIERSPGYYSQMLADHEARKRRLVASFGEPTGTEGRFLLPWRITRRCLAGHQEDPFHSSDVYWRTHRGACDIEIEHRKRPDVVLRFGDLVAVLIRRACFFEGAVPYRLDPEQAAWVLALSNQPPATSK